MRDFIGKILGFYDEINALKVTNYNLGQDIERLKKTLDFEQDRVEQLQKEASKLLGEVNMLEKQVVTPNPHEEFWNNKYPKENIQYSCRTFPKYKKRFSVDVRVFFTNSDYKIEEIVKKKWVGIGKLDSGSYDERALKCLKWVRKNFKYAKDDDTTGMSEHWSFPFEALKFKKGDCEDGAILLANIMLAADIPYWRVRLNASDVGTEKNKFGHLYVTYCRETDNEFVVVDWTFKYKKTKISERPLHKDERSYYNVRFSWNKKYACKKVKK